MAYYDFSSDIPQGVNTVLQFAKRTPKPLIFKLTRFRGERQRGPDPLVLNAVTERTVQSRSSRPMARLMMELQQLIGSKRHQGVSPPRVVDELYFNAAPPGQW
jgi:hypothetical protein